METSAKPIRNRKSLSLRRAWIEITSNVWESADARSLSLRRAWIEIATHQDEGTVSAGRSPYGERGLKFSGADFDGDTVLVALLTESVD